jgi:PAS domain S-box-containing protein
VEWKRKDGGSIWVKNYARCVKTRRGIIYLGIVEVAVPPYRSDLPRSGVWSEKEILGGNLDEMFDSMPICVAYKDRKGVVRYANQLFCQREAKCEPRDLPRLKLTDFKLYPKELAERYRQDDQVVLSTGASLEYTEPHVRGQRGARRKKQAAPEDLFEQAHVLKLPAWNARMKICGVLCMFWEASEEGVALQETIRRAQQDALVSASTFRIVYEHDLEGRFLTLNAAGQRLCGYSEEDFTRLKVEDIVTKPYLVVVRRMMDRKRQSQADIPISKYRVDIRHADGKQIIPLEVVTILVSEAGKERLIRGHARDLRGDRSTEESARHSVGNYLLGILSGIQRELSRNASDEIRTPLENITKRIRAAAWLIENAGIWDPGAQRSALQTLMEFVKYFGDVYEIEKSNIRLDVECPEALVVPGDLLNNILQCVLELATNCLKYAFPEGGSGNIHICLTELSDNTFELTVSDNGVGMGRRFERTERARSGKGLKLVGLIARSHQGKLELPSPDNSTQGTRVAVTFKPSWHLDAAHTAGAS